MKEKNIDTTKQEALLNSTENGLAEFIMFNNTENKAEASDDNTFFWPLKKLPDAIRVGDKVNVSLELSNKEERQEELQKKQEQEEKYAKMRKQLEVLIN
jgi:hypothetical protein